MTLIEKARRLRKQNEDNAQFMSDETALEFVDLFAKWKPGEAYAVGLKLRHNNILYKVLQAHTSQEGWEPDAAPSLFAKVLIPDPEVIPEWEQPDSTNPYMTGDKVAHNGQNWICDIDNNVWEPGVYGWSVIK